MRRRRRRKPHLGERWRSGVLKGRHPPPFLHDMMPLWRWKLQWYLYLWCGKNIDIVIQCLWQTRGRLPRSVHHVHDKFAEGDEYCEDDEDDNLDEEGDDDPCVRPCMHSWPGVGNECRVLGNFSRFIRRTQRAARGLHLTLWRTVRERRPWVGFGLDEGCKKHWTYIREAVNKNLTQNFLGGDLAISNYKDFFCRNKGIHAH